MLRPFGSRPPWWIWVGAGVVWGLLCVGVRLLALQMGHDMDASLAKRHALVAKVQELERELAEVKRYEKIEKQAYSLGFIKPGARQLVIVAPEPEEGLLARFFRVGSKREEETGAGPASFDEETEQLMIRPREEVVVKEPGKASGKSRRKRAIRR